MNRFSGLSGIEPREWICVGQGFGREELKAGILAAGSAFVSSAVTSTQELAAKIAGLPKAGALSSSARQEVLRALIANPALTGRFPEFQRLKRQAQFFKRADRAIQSARLSFASPTEYDAMIARVGDSELKREFRMLAVAYEAWCEARASWDLPMALSRAIERLGAGAAFKFPEIIRHYSVARPEGRERLFWDEVRRHCKVEWVGATATETPGTGCRVERWHTIDDAAERLADALVGCEESDSAVLIPDEPSIRRSVLRAFRSRGLSLEDPRDPTRLRWDESVKHALLPLEVVARNFEREGVESWLRAHHFTNQHPLWIKEIAERGVTDGLGAYSGGRLEGLHAELKALSGKLGGRRRCRDLADAHLALLDETGRLESDMREFFESLWKGLCDDMERLELSRRRAPPGFWLERLEERLEEATPPVERIKVAGGVKLYRLAQAPVAPASRLWVLGLPPEWLSAARAGDLWFSDRDRERLSEFEVRGPAQVRRERHDVLRSWLGGATRATFLDAAYEWDGAERPSLEPLLLELGVAVGEAIDAGAHPRWLPSYGAFRPSPPAEVRLPSLTSLGQTELTASDIEAFSRCGFQALAGRRWRLDDVNEPDGELWADVAGNLLHAAVRILLMARTEEGGFEKTAARALDEAWSEKRPKGLVRGRRLESYARARLVGLLEKFMEVETEYARRSGTRIFSLEGPELKLAVGGVTVKGVPDRIDEHSEGLFIQDFKSSTQVPSGAEMLEKGYRLQLPFYAIAAEAQLGQPVIGVQFVELSKKGGRTRGFFFEAFNGKEPGKLIKTTRANRSLLAMEPHEAWSRAGEQIRRDVEAIVAGTFSARPRKDDECGKCRYRDFCGERRRLGSEEEGE